MQYALMIYERPGAYEPCSDEERHAVNDEYIAIGQDPRITAGAQLQPTDTATTVRVQDGRTLTTDGPFAETKEVFGGYFLLDADDLDAALEVAARIPAARLGGAVEVRPLVQWTVTSKARQ